MRISAKVDYAVRAMCELAAHPGDTPLKAEEIARAQEIPLSFLENILVDLRRAGFVRSQRGQVGGYRMAEPASDITVADVIGYHEHRDSIQDVLRGDFAKTAKAARGRTIRAMDATAS